MKIGTCTKCGKSGKIVMRHEHGYDEEHDQDVKPYCVSCTENKNCRITRKA